ncbi:FkbM family methyltransferase [Pelagovum pacificum]|uniref:FkbM family methyltransferase n=1 Tax=Pelagovum pacificum TaxID=2588711 RepID=A0A5C5GH78_9RHOB|nr:FkbM family methyltransferase [Pelagovum pacificum]QQA42727.1 FkbM family methyltransferase [Pelagovum pacificum]TNY34122.1 FkbM family methyltransferase [Pelagovum pacificum]
MTPQDRLRSIRADLVELRKDLIGTLKDERSRKRGELNRQLHEVTQMLVPQYLYSSQAGQDAVVDRLMNHRTGGTFLDIGGYDGVSGSNTLFLEQYRGWTGVLVEPVPAQFEKASAVRRCQCLQVAVAPTSGEADFIEVQEGYTQMSGLAQSYDEGLLKTVRDDPRHKEQVLKVETRTLSDIMITSGLPDPDFVSLDIEGGEITALEAFPFAQHDVKIWSIENNSASKRIPEIMRDNGYELIEFCGPDDVYRKRPAG